MTPTTTIIEYDSRTATVYRASVGRCPSVLLTLRRSNLAPTEVVIHTIDGEPFSLYETLTFAGARWALRDEGAHGVIYDVAAAAEQVVPDILDAHTAEEVRQFRSICA